MKKQETIFIRPLGYLNLNGVEIWGTTMTPIRYFARGLEGVWHFVDNLATCTPLANPCPHDYRFMICDERGVPQYEITNGTKFPTFYETLMSALDTERVCPDNILSPSSRQDWMRRFYDAVVKEQIMQSNDTPRDPFTVFYSECNIRGVETVAEFTWSGKPYRLERVTKVSAYDDHVRWYEYIVYFDKSSGSYNPAITDVLLGWEPITDGDSLKEKIEIEIEMTRTHYISQTYFVTKEQLSLIERGENPFYDELKAEVASGDVTFDWCVTKDGETILDWENR